MTTGETYNFIWEETYGRFLDPALTTPILRALSKAGVAEDRREFIDEISLSRRNVISIETGVRDGRIEAFQPEVPGSDPGQHKT